MALDVGELAARLTLDDSRFIQGTRRAEQTSQQVTSRITTGFQDISRAAQRAGQAAEAVALNDRLDRQARDAARRIQELEQNARRADQSVDDITMNTRLLDEARRAAREIDDLRATARQAAGAVDDIDLGNRLRDQLRDAQGELDDLYRQAGDGGGPAGQRGGSSFLSSFASAVGDLGSKTGPIGASLLGVAAIGLTAGAALAAAIKDGMAAELKRDLFQAQTGVTVAQARAFARAAGEAYADTFGESVEANLDTARHALASGLLDPGATQRDAEQMIRSLDGVARILGEDIPAVSRSASQAIKTGFAADANDAFDLMVKGAQMGLNVSDDWLDTIDEYGTQFRQLGLTGAESIGLMSQALDAGAFNTDKAADALKEFAIRAQDGSEASAEGYRILGLSAEEMTSQIAAGGQSARDGLGLVLDKLREIEDPVARNAAAVALFGTQAEDLGQALYSMDLSTAVEQMNNYEGAARTAIEVMTGNAATSVEGAMRAIKVAADGLKAALAEAFGPYIQQFADNISNNRAGVIQFFIDIGNKAFDGAQAILEFVSSGMRGLAELAVGASQAAESMLGMFASIVDGAAGVAGAFGLSWMFPDLDSAGDKIRGLADTAGDAGQAISDGLNKGADFIDDTLIPAVDNAQDRFNGFAGNLKLSAAFNDEIAKVNDVIDNFGAGLDGSQTQIENWTGSLDRSIPAQSKMHDELSKLKGMFLEQNRAGLEAGATVEELTAQYRANRDQLIAQAQQMGLTKEQAEALINAYGLVPDLVDTQIRQPGMPEAQYALDVLKGKVLDVPDEKTIHTEALTTDAMDALKALGLKVETLPDGTVLITADTDDGQAAIDNFINNNNGRAVQMFVNLRQRRIGYWTDQGYSPEEAPRIQGPVPVAADGAVRDPQIRQGRGRGIIWAEQETVKESYIPWAASKRPRAEKILAATAQHFGLGLVKMADGGITDPSGFDSQAAVAKAMAHDGEPYVYGGLDCSGYLSAVFNAGTGQNVRFTTDSDFASMGWEPGYDPDGFNIGTNGGVGVNGHMAGTLYGTNIESDGSNGIQYGGTADGAQDFPQVWHWPGATAGDDPSLERLGDSSESTSSAGTTSGGVSMSTDGQRVFVTNWPNTITGGGVGGGVGGGGGSTPPRSVSISTGGGGGTPQTAGLTTPDAPPDPLKETFGEFGRKAGDIGTNAALDILGLSGTPLDPNHRYWQAIRDTGRAFAGMSEQRAQQQQAWQTGPQITNNVTVSNDQEQVRRLMDMMKRLLAQYGGATV